MKQRILKSIVVISAVTLALAAAATVHAFLGVPDESTTFPPNPWAGKPDAERHADVDAAHKRNDDYLRDFIASGADPRTLPRLAISDWNAGEATEDASTKRAELIVRGKVESTKFTLRPSSEGLPISVSVIRVSETQKGQPRDVVEVRQLGGPVAQEKGGAFAHLASSEPFFPDDEVILLLEQAADGMMVTQPGTGIYVVRNGIVEAGGTNPFGGQMNGRTADEVVASLRASLARAEGS